MEDIENMPKQTYRKIIKKKIIEFSLKYLLEKRYRRNGKGMEIHNEKLAMQPYLRSEDINISNEERQFMKVLFVIGANWKSKKPAISWNVKISLKEMIY